jgi:hypothetical protein
MCHRIRILAKNKQGQLSYCSGCNVYKLTFNNLSLELYPDQLNNLKDYVGSTEKSFSPSSKNLDLDVHLVLWNFQFLLI